MEVEAPRDPALHKHPPRKHSPPHNVDTPPPPAAPTAVAHALPRRRREMPHLRPVAGPLPRAPRRGLPRLPPRGARRPRPLPRPPPRGRRLGRGCGPQRRLRHHIPCVSPIIQPLTCDLVDDGDGEHTIAVTAKQVSQLKRKQREVFNRAKYEAQCKPEWKPVMEGYDVRVGDTLRAIGVLEEWSWKEGVVRQMVVSPNAGGSIRRSSRLPTDRSANN